MVPTLPKPEALLRVVQPVLVGAAQWPLQGEALWHASEAELAALPWPKVVQASGVDSLIIFDWDDTIMPTTALTEDGYFAELPPGEEGDTQRRLSELLLWRRRAELTACAEAAMRALRAARRRGKVIVVTNAIRGWVPDTAARFLPELMGELDDLTVISARSIYEPQGIAEPWQWKALCFERIARCFQFDPDGIQGPKSLVSIGDSWHERAAAFKTGQELGAGCFVKSVKLAERPTVDVLTQQLDLCARQLDQLASHDGSLDLRVQPGLLELVWCAVAPLAVAPAHKGGALEQPAALAATEAPKPAEGYMAPVPEAAPPMVPELAAEAAAPRTSLPPWRRLVPAPAVAAPAPCPRPVVVPPPHWAPAVPAVPARADAPPPRLAALRAVRALQAAKGQRHGPGNPMRLGTWEPRDRTHRRWPRPVPWKGHSSYCSPARLSPPHRNKRPPARSVWLFMRQGMCLTKTKQGWRR